MPFRHQSGHAWVVKNTNLELRGGDQARYAWESSIGEHMSRNPKKQNKD